MGWAARQEGESVKLAATARKEKTSQRQKGVFPGGNQSPALPFPPPPLLSKANWIGPKEGRYTAPSRYEKLQNPQKFSISTPFVVLLLELAPLLLAGTKRGRGPVKIALQEPYYYLLQSY